MYGIYNYKNDINIFWFHRKFSYYCYLKSNEQSSFYFNYCWKYTDRNLRSFNFSFYSISIFSSLIRSFDLIPHIFGFSEYKSRIDKLNLSSLPLPFLFFFFFFFPLKLSQLRQWCLRNILRELSFREKWHEWSFL